ncbi:MAG: 4Fe-4S binding protein [Candidatus Helarchaeota archaeon]
MAQKTIIALNKEIEEFLKKRGAIRVGFSTLETLKDGPPSTDITYVLPEAKSAVTFALKLDREIIRKFLAKELYQEAEDDDIEVNKKVQDISNELAEWLRKKGYKAKAAACNNKYRQEIKGWQQSMPPELSHRYLGAVSGVGSLGWSGNLGIKGYGTAIILGSIVTDAELAPTSRIPEDENFCTNCKLCVAACPADMFDASEKTEVTIGGETFSYSKRNNILRCQLVCGGFSGLHKSGKWSTWSPGRFKIPDDESKILSTLATAFFKYTKWPERIPKSHGGTENPVAPGVKLHLTCGNCQKICWGDEEENRKNWDLLRNSGCVLQKPNGEIVVLPPDEAQKMFNEFPRKHKRLYY